MKIAQHTYPAVCDECGVTGEMVVFGGYGFLAEEVWLCESCLERALELLRGHEADGKYERYTAVKPVPAPVCTHPDMQPSRWGQIKPCATAMLRDKSCYGNFTCPVCGRTEI